MKNKKNLFITFLLIIILAVSSIAFLKIYYTITFDEKDLRNAVITLFKSKLNRAVKFEEIKISFTGDITLSRFNLSVSSDFNDNLSFISSPQILIDLDFFDLFLGKITINGIKISDAEMNILKRYGKDYTDVADQFIDLTNRLNNFAQSQSGAFNIIMTDSLLAYREIFKDDEIIINLYDINTTLKIFKEDFTYTLSTSVSPSKPDDSSKGSISSSGNIKLNTKGSYNHKVKIDNLDLSYFNRFIQEKTGINLSLKGGISTDCIIYADNNQYSFTGSIETYNLNIYTYSPEPHSLISNENLNIYSNFKIDLNAGIYQLKEFKLFDDYCSLTGSAEYINNKANHSIKAKLQSNRINLTELSNYISPVSNVYYSGTLAFNLDFDYDILDNIIHTSKFNLALSGFNVKDISKEKKRNLIQDMTAEITMENNKIDTSLEAVSGNTDMRLTSNTTIESWYPIKSNSEIALYSKISEFSLIYSITSRIFKSLIDDAYEDSKKGYEEVFFLQKPFGKFITNNDFTFDFNSDKVLVNDSGKVDKDQGFKNIAFGVSMKNGVFSLRDFHLWGYNAVYDLDLQGYFFRDYPHITCTGSVKNFDLASFSSEAPMQNKLTGVLNGNFEYELNIYRISHLLQNSRSTLNLQISHGDISESFILGKLNEFVRNNNYNMNDLTIDEYNSINLSTQQYGENVYIKNFGYKGNHLTFNLSGKYTYRDGLDLTGGCTVEVLKKQKESDVIQQQYLPVAMTGPIAEPCLEMRKKKDSVKTCFKASTP